MPSPETRWSRVKRIVRRIVRIAVRTLAGIVALVVLLILVLLYSETATRLALQIGLGIYNDMIPGGISVGRIDGRLGTRVDLSLVEVVDSSGTRMAAVDTLTLQLRPWAILGGTAAVDYLGLSQVEVVVDGAWGDLAPPPSDEPPPPPEPDAGLGPDLPLEILLRVELADTRLLQTTPEGTVPLVDGISLSLAARAAGKRARVVVESLSAHLQEPDLHLHHIGFVVDWADPRIDLRALAIDSDLVTGEIRHARVDFETMYGHVFAQLGVATDSLAVAGLPERLDLLLGGQHNTEGVRLALDANLGDRALTQFTLDGPLDLERQVVAILRTDIAPELLGLPTGPRLRPNLRATLDGPLTAARAEASVACEDCGLLSGNLGLELTGNLRAGDVDARIEGGLAGVKLNAFANISAGKPTQAQVKLGVPRLRKLPPLPGVPKLAGGLDITVNCREGAVKLPCTAKIDLRQFSGVGVGLAAVNLQAKADVPLEPAAGDLKFDGRVRVRQLRVADQHVDEIVVHAKGSPADIRGDVRVVKTPGQTLHLAARIRPGPPLRVDLTELDASFGAFASHLNQPGAVKLDGDKIEVAHLDLDVARGNLSVDGVFDRGGVSDLSVGISQVDLSTLAGVVPGLSLGGRVDLNTKLRGGANAPNLTLDVDVRDFALGGRDLGQARVSATLRGRKLTAETHVTLAGTTSPALVADLEVPVKVDLQTGQFAQLAGTHRAHVQLHPVDVAWANRFLPADGPQLSGGLTGDVVISGPARRPDVRVDVRGEDLSYGPLAIGDPSFELRYDDKLVTTQVRVEQGFADEIVVEAAVPAGLRLAPPSLQIQKKRTLQANIDVRGFDLVTVEPLLALVGQLADPSAPAPEVPFGGKVDLGVSLAGTLQRPTFDVDVATRGLRFYDHGLGDTQVHVGHRDDVLTAAVHHSGGLLEQLDLAAEVPIELRAEQGQVNWQTQGPHRLTLGVRGFDPARTDLLGVPHDVSGKVHVQLEAEAVGGVPKARTVIEVARLQYLEKDLLTGGIGIDLESDGVQLLTNLKGPGQSKVDLGIHVPVEVGLTGAPVWNRDAEHQLHVHAHLARQLLLAGVPEKFLGRAASVDTTIDGKGSFDKFSINGQVHGEVRTRQGTRQAVDAAVAVGPERQTLDLALDPGSTSSRVELHAQSQISTPSLLTDASGVTTAPIRADVLLPYLTLETLSSFLPEALAEPKGYASGRFALAGTVGEPTVRGNLALKGGEITVVPLLQRIRGIDMEVVASGQRVELKQLAFQGGAGTGKLTATADYDPKRGVVAQADLALDKFTIAPPGLPETQISTRVHTDARVEGAGTKVEVGVRDTTIWIDDSQTSAAKPISRSPAVAFVDPAGRRAAEREEQPPEVAPSSNFELALKLHDPILLRGTLVEMNWGGGLSATVVDGKQNVDGALVANRGFVDLFGTKLEIDHGEVTLVEGADGLDPYLELTAATDIDGIRVMAVLRGRASSPEIEFVSEPQLPAYQVLALLVTGNAEVDDTTRDEVEAKAASLLAVVASPGLQRSMRKHLGIDRVRLSFGESLMQPVLSVGKRVSRKVYTEASYKQNARTGDNTVQLDVQYNFRPEWSLDTYFGDAAKGGVDVFWRRHFGEPKPRGRRRKAKQTGPQSPPRNKPETPADTKK